MPRELFLRLSSKAKWILGFISLTAGVMAVVLIDALPPVWMLVLLVSVGLALLYIIARLRSRYDPRDLRFGSCIPPINLPRAIDSTSSVRPEKNDHPI